MTVTTVNSANVAEIWDSNFFKEYVRDNRFKRYMGTNENSVIQVKEDLTKKRGDGITIPLVTKLSGAGQTGNSTLEGQEEALGNYGHKITVDTRRHGVAVTDHDQQFTEISLRDAGKEMLKLWSMEKLKTDIITALGSIAGTAYGSATEGAKDTWVAANADRVLFGDSVGNGGYTDHSADLLTVTAAMTLGKAEVSLMKRMAKRADPLIRPIRVNDDEEWYVLFTDSLCFRDLKLDLDSVHQNAAPRSLDSNPIFRDGDLVYDGVIIREIPEIASLGAVGNTSATVSPAYLCGAQALGVAWAQRTKSTTDVRDYGFVKGVGIHEMLGVDKLVFNGVDHGVLKGYFGAAADA